MIYENFKNYVDFINKNEILQLTNFKSNENFITMLNHVSFTHGNEYINLIKNFFPGLKYKNVNEFVLLNDEYGVPNKQHFMFDINEPLICCPTSLTSRKPVYHR